MIYDRLNVHLGGNHHSMPGMCQLCETHTHIFECPICGQTPWLYIDNEEGMCHDGHCATKGVDYAD